MITPRMKLGKQPPRVDPRTLKLKAYLPLDPAVAPFTVPSAKNWATAVSSWPMLANDTYGDCVEAAAYHLVQCWLAADSTPVTPNVDDVLRWYSDLTGFDPANPDTDCGTAALDALNKWRQVGLPWYLNGTAMRHKIDGYAQITHMDREEIKLAISEFGGAYLGAAMPLAAQSQFAEGRAWACTAGISGAPGGWGGHAVPAVGYTARYVYVVTWGKVQRATWGWVERYVEEAYAVLASDWYGVAGVTVNGVDVARLRADIAAIR